MTLSTEQIVASLRANNETDHAQLISDELGDKKLTILQKHGADGSGYPNRNMTTGNDGNG